MTTKPQTNLSNPPLTIRFQIWKKTTRSSQRLSWRRRPIFLTGPAVNHTSYDNQATDQPFKPSAHNPVSDLEENNKVLAKAFLAPASNLPPRPGREPHIL